MLYCIVYEGWIVATVNILFGQKWFLLQRNMELNIRTEQYIEAMALSLIVVETMLDDSVSCVVYSNEGSSQSVTGSYVV